MSPVSSGVTKTSGVYGVCNKALSLERGLYDNLCDSSFSKRKFLGDHSGLSSDSFSVRDLER